MYIQSLLTPLFQTCRLSRLQTVVLKVKDSNFTQFSLGINDKTVYFLNIILKKQFKSVSETDQRGAHVSF